MSQIPRILTPKDTFTVDYPQAVAYADVQSSVFWPHDEIKVHKDKHDILSNMTEAERHATITTLKLFTKYELIIGEEFWLNFVFNEFPRCADIRPMAAMFGAMELQVHAKFYSKINEELGLATDDFYNEYLNDPVMVDRMNFLNDMLAHPNRLQRIGCFCFGEGAVLYSSFGFLKHFQTQGKNKLLNVVSGINFSVRDENLHSEAAAWLFRTTKQEMIECGLHTDEDEAILKADVYEAARKVYEHETQLIAKLFEKGPIEGITAHQLERFAMSRINLCLRNLGYTDLEEVTYNPIKDWFYKNINSYHMGDFFSSTSNSYKRGWSAEGFTF